VAGSTWPEDERVLLEAARVLSGEGKDAASRLELVLVPHEPEPAAVERIRVLCRELLGVEPRLWSRGESEAGGAGDAPPDAPLIVDAVGFLADLYLEADLAWIGGGVGGEGLHSVVEPAAAAIPVLFGPVQDRWEARELVHRGAALEPTPEEVAGAIASLLARPERREEMGARARAFVEAGRGAAAASAELVASLIDRGWKDGGSSRA
jgi:3-deoxy-D-manno-octulosonic-acid transferase